MKEIYEKIMEQGRTLGVTTVAETVDKASGDRDNVLESTAKTDTSNLTFLSGIVYITGRIQVTYIVNELNLELGSFWKKKKEKHLQSALSVFHPKYSDYV